MKTIKYIIIGMIICATVFTGLPSINGQGTRIKLVSKESTMSRGDLELSKEILSERIKAFTDVNFNIDLDFNSMEIIINLKQQEISTDLMNLLTVKGDLLFAETFDRMEVLSHLDKDDRFFKLMKTDDLNDEGPVLGVASPSDLAEIRKHIESESFRSKLSPDILLSWGIPDENEQTCSLYALKKHLKASPPIGNGSIEKVEEYYDTENGSTDILITFNEYGRDEWFLLTQENIGRCLAIVLDGKVYQAPKVAMAIEHGKCSITGKFDENSALTLVSLLKNEPLPSEFSVSYSKKE